MIKALTKQDNVYYFYALLPNRESNFSLRIEGAEYIDSGEIKNKKIIKNFTIKKTNEYILLINPGFIITNKDFSVKIKPLSNQKISATLEATGETKNFSLIEESEDTLKFSISNATSGRTNLKINNYNIPIFIYKEIVAGEIIRLDFNPSELRAKVFPGKDYYFNLLLQNSGNKDLTNITISNNINANIFPVIIKSFKAGDNVYLNLTIPVSNGTKDTISGYIIIKSNDNNFSVPVILEITNNQKEVNLTQTGITQSLNCIYIGRICLENKECGGEITYSIEGHCCKGECVEIKKTSYSWLIGIILVLIVIGAVAYVYFKSRKKQRSRTTEEIFNEKSKALEERMSGKEVSGKLDRI